MKKYFLFLGVLPLLFLPFLSFAWQPPLVPPPNGDTPPPINSSNNGQTKLGGLIVGLNKCLDGSSLNPDCGPAIPVGLGFSVRHGNMSIGILKNRLGNERSPIEKLDIEGKIRATQFCVPDPSGADTNGDNIIDSFCTSTFGGGGSGDLSGTGTTNFLTKWSGEKALVGSSLIFENNNTVGIGIVSPTALVHVNDEAITPPAQPVLKITRQNNIVNNTNQQLNPDYAGLYINTKDFPLNVEANNIPAITVDKDARVTLGFSTLPTFPLVQGQEDLKLKVNGNIGATKYCDAEGMNCRTISNLLGSGDISPDRIMPIYSTGLLSVPGRTGDGGASIVNDGTEQKALVILGNVSDGTTERKVKVYDQLEVVGPIESTGPGSALCIGADCRTSWPTVNPTGIIQLNPGNGIKFTDSSNNNISQITNTGTISVDPAKFQRRPANGDFVCPAGEAI
ncbi:MAG: hypothetical protein AAB965_03060, partial [Patescibacteria group bacterium]